MHSAQPYNHIVPARWVARAAGAPGESLVLGALRRRRSLGRRARSGDGCGPSSGLTVWSGAP